MNRTALALLAVSALSVGVAQPSLAATKAKGPKPKPVTSTYYLHSVSNGGTGNGNVNAVAALPDGGTGILPMDAKAPTGSSDQDYGTFGAAGQPNPQCLGNNLTMHAAWAGNAVGTLTDKVVVTFFARSTPGNAVVQLFTDQPDVLACNADFPGTISETSVPLPSSPTFTQVTATLTLAKPVVVKSGFTVQIFADGATAQASDIGFDSTTAPSHVTWTCVPNAGKKTC
jgi:hypothetical protein